MAVGGELCAEKGSLKRSVLTCGHLAQALDLGNTFAPSVAENHDFILRQWKTASGF